MVDFLFNIRQKTTAFEEEAHKILSKHETSKSRVITLEQTRIDLTVLTIRQNELFQEAIICIENGVYRAAHVMAWAGFIDFLEEKLASDGLIKVKAARSTWAKHRSIEELRENVPEYQLIDVAQELGIVPKSGKKSIQGHLAKRNECAHPGSYTPRLNESLGYVSELLSRIKSLQKKSL